MNIVLSSPGEEWRTTALCPEERTTDISSSPGGGPIKSFCPVGVEDSYILLPRGERKTDDSSHWGGGGNRYILPLGEAWKELYLPLGRVVKIILYLP